MAYIAYHGAFVGAVRNLLDQDARFDLVDKIDADSRDRMNEPEYFGLDAIAIAEKWFDEQSQQKILVRKQGKAGLTMLDYKEIGGAHNYLLENGSPIAVDPDWQIIAISQV